MNAHAYFYQQYSLNNMNRLLLIVIFFPMILLNNRHLVNDAMTFTPTTIYMPYTVNQDKTILRIKSLEYLFINDPNQQRLTFVADEILMKVALEKALDMAQRNYYDHVSPEGIGANTLVRNEGYELPDNYDQNLSGNNIESLMNSTDSANEVWQAWLDSPGHRMHVLGEHPEFKKQIHYGIGYAENLNSVHQHFWVLLSAPPPR